MLTAIKVGKRERKLDSFLLSPSRIDTPSFWNLFFVRSLGGSCSYCPTRLHSSTPGLAVPPRTVAVALASVAEGLAHRRPSVAVWLCDCAAVCWLGE